MISIDAKLKDYIPKDLDDALKFLHKHVSKDEKELVASDSIDIVLGHHTLGRALRNNWGLWRDSRLAKWFNERGIGHADDMSGIILDSFERELRGQERNLDEQIKHYRDYWRQQGTDPDQIGNLKDD